MTDTNVEMTEATVDILNPEFVTRANEICNNLVANAEKARAGGDKKNIVTKAQICEAIGKEFNVPALAVYDGDKLDNVRGGAVFDTFVRLGLFAGTKCLQGPYGGVQFGEKGPKKSKAEKATATISTIVSKLTDAQKAELLASLQPAPAPVQTEQPTA